MDAEQTQPVVSLRLGRFRGPFRRVVCLCPSLTETLFALGLDETNVVGRTRYCVHPAERVGSVPVVGGTKTIDVGRVRALRPDLVIAVREENPRPLVEELAATLPVLVLGVTDFATALAAIAELGRLLDRATEAERLTDAIERAFAAFPPQGPWRVAYLVWRRPWMAVGGNTYIHAILEKCGLRNVCARLAGRYPELTVDTLRRLAPDYVLLPSEPYPFGQTHAARLAAELAGAGVLCVDGQMFGWYGSRMLAAARYLRKLLGFLGSDDPRPGPEAPA